MNKKLLIVDADHQVGEVRHVDGLLSMCLGERNYGGGSGPVWATPGETVEFTVTKSAHRGYFIGICQAIYPRRKSIALLIVKGSTWGDFKTGNAIEIKAERVARYHAVNRESEFTLSDLAESVASHTYANELFRELTLKELEEAYREELSEVSRTFLGTKAYVKAQEITNAYVAFAQTIRETRSDLSRQPSQKVLASARRVRAALGLEPTSVASDDSGLLPKGLNLSQSAAYGSIIGAFVGDAAGGVLEFLGRRPTRADVDKALGMPGGGVFGLAPGQITDDGELALCLLRALADRDGDFDASLVARYYIEWADSKPFDIGMATSNALSVHGYELRDPASVVLKAAAESNTASKANGALMRVTPLAVASVKVTENQAIEWARTDARMTHPHPTCMDVNAAYVLAIRHLILNPGEGEQAIRTALSYLNDQGSEAAEWMTDAIEGQLPDAHPQAGFVRIAFTYAFHHLNRKSSLRPALADTLLRGGDTDTNACIVGGLIGAYRGIDKLINSEVSRKLIFPVLMCDPSLGQPRPESYHAGSSIFWIPKIL